MSQGTEESSRKWPEQCTRNREEGQRAPEIKHRITPVYILTQRPRTSTWRFSSSLTHAGVLLAERPVPVDNFSSASSAGPEQGPFPTATTAFFDRRRPPWAASRGRSPESCTPPAVCWSAVAEGWLAKGGRTLLSLPGSGLLCHGPASSHRHITFVRSNQAQEVRGGRQREEKL